MCIETHLREIHAHLHVVMNGGGLHLISDEIDRNHIISAYIESIRAIDELRNAPRAALIETIPSEAEHA